MTLNFGVGIKGIDLIEKSGKKRRCFRQVIGTSHAVNQHVDLLCVLFRLAKRINRYIFLIVQYSLVPP